jgi:hypothetical protein
VRGLNRWKRAFGANSGFLRHQASQSHIKAQWNYQEHRARRSLGSSVGQVINKAHIEEVKRNREKLVRIVSTLNLCARQMIALRGHDENES